MTAILFAVLYAKAGLSVDLAFLVTFTSLLMVISFIDIEHLMIPDFLMLAGIAVGVAYSLYKGDLADSLLGICFGFLFMYAVGEAARFILKKDALGEGDVKLMVMLGSFLGIQGAVFTIIFGSVAGALIGLMLIALKVIRREDYIPFGPFLAIGAVVSILI